MDFQNCFVNGRISQFGTIRILPNECREGVPIYGYGTGKDGPYEQFLIIGRRLFDSNDGTLYYSPRLHLYPGKRATITESGAVAVSEEDGTIVATTNTSDLYHLDVDPQKGRVHPLGYVFYPELGGGNAFDDIALGKTPRYCDNHLFACVDAELAGAQVIVLWFHTGNEKKRAVFHPDGRAIPCTTGRPLAFERWGREIPTDSFDSEGDLHPFDC